MQTPCPWEAWRRRCRTHLHRALCLPSLPGPLLRVQAWGHLGRWGLDPRELTLQGITGAKALFGVLPPHPGNVTVQVANSGAARVTRTSGPHGAGCTCCVCFACPCAQDMACAMGTACASCAQDVACAMCPGRGRHHGHCVCAMCPGRGMHHGHCVCAICPGHGMCLGHCTCARDVARAISTAREPGVWVEGKVLKDVRSLSGIFPNC